jgi:hypothetical protein
VTVAPTRSRAAAVLAGTLLLAGTSGCSCSSSGSTPGRTSAPPSYTGRPEQSYELRYEGAMKGSSVLDSSGRDNAGTVTAGGGGSVTGQQAEAADQQAKVFLRFPPGQCDQPTDCPQAMVEPARPVNPGSGGSASFSFGARVRLQGDPGEAGENVIERGRAVAGQAQWKLQADHGQASCRWSDGATTLLLPTDLGQTFALDQGRWYDLECDRRAGGVFALVVRDPVSGQQLAEFTKTLPTLGPIVPKGPVSIGAKRIGGPDLQTDQFRGDLDDIFFHTD